MITSWLPYHCFWTHTIIIRNLFSRDVWDRFFRYLDCGKKYEKLTNNGIPDWGICNSVLILTAKFGMLRTTYYTNIKRGINQSEFGSFNVYLANLTNLYSHGKTKLNSVKTCKNETKLNQNVKKNLYQSFIKYIFVSLSLFV